MSETICDIRPGSDSQLTVDSSIELAEATAPPLQERLHRLTEQAEKQSGARVIRPEEGHK